MDISNTSKSVSSKIMIVVDPTDLDGTMSPITYTANIFLHGVFGDSIEEREIDTISYLLNVVEAKIDRATGNKTWNFLPENIERIMSVLKGIRLGPNCHIHLTTYDSILSVLLATVAKMVNAFVPSEHY